MSHSVQRLAVHLPGWQSVLFQEGLEREALENAAGKHSTLEAWFQFNQNLVRKGDTIIDGTDFAAVHYIDMPLHCVWNVQ